MSIWKNQTTPPAPAHNDTTSRDAPGNHSLLAPSSDGADAISIRKADATSILLGVDTTTGIIKIEDALLVGHEAIIDPYPDAKIVAAETLTGHFYTGKIGISGEAVSDGTDTATGIGGNAKSSGAFAGRGVVGVGKVSNTADTGKAIGLFGRATDTHAGDSNIAVYANAQNGATNYSFYGENGDVYNNGSAKLGAVGAGNYSEIEADGTYHMLGDATVWDDIIVQAGNLRPGATPPAFAAFTGGIYQPSFVQGEADEVHGCFEIPHDYKEGSALVAHIHCAPSSTNVGNLVVGFEYGALSDDSIATATTNTPITPLAMSGVAKKIRRIDVATIAGTNRKIGDVIPFRFYRQNGGTDTFTGNLFVLSIGIHYECDTIGSRQITTK
jgi:hypothetical protein